MLQFSDLKIEEAVAIQSEAMESGDHFKNGASSKSLMSRRNILTNALNRKFLLALLAAVLTVGYAQAQMTFGARAGVNFTNIRFTTTVAGFSQSVFFNMKPGFQVGAVVEEKIGKSDRFFAQSGLLISSQKSVFDRVEYSSGSLPDIEFEDDVIISLTYLRVPINFGFKKDFGDMTFVAFGGPYLGLAVAGKIEDEKIEFGKIGKGIMSRLDTGINLSPGLQFGNFQAAIEYSIGFGVDSESSVTRLTLINGFALNLTYLFNK